MGHTSLYLQLPDGQKVELGATWLHGIQGHPVYDLAVHYGLMAPHKKKGKSLARLVTSLTCCMKSNMRLKRLIFCSLNYGFKHYGTVERVPKVLAKIHRFLIDPHGGNSSGTDFWRGSHFLREGEQSALDADSAQKAGHTVSIFAETVDECSEIIPAPASVGEALREKFQQVGEEHASDFTQS